MQVSISIGITIQFNIDMNMIVGIRGSINVNMSIRIVRDVSAKKYVLISAQKKY